MRHKILLPLLAHFTMSFSAFASCILPKNPIEAENCLPGNPPSEWYVVGAGATNIQGFTSDICVNPGQTVYFKIEADARSYLINIYRLGYYQGADARKVAAVLPSVPLPQSQPACLTDNSTGLTDCGNWAISASWALPVTAICGAVRVPCWLEPLSRERRLPAGSK